MTARNASDEVTTTLTLVDRPVRADGLRADPAVCRKIRAMLRTAKVDAHTAWSYFVMIAPSPRVAELINAYTYDLLIGEDADDEFSSMMTAFILGRGSYKTDKGGFSQSVKRGSVTDLVSRAFMKFVKDIVDDSRMIPSTMPLKYFGDAALIATSCMDFNNMMGLATSPRFTARILIDNGGALSALPVPQRVALAVANCIQSGTNIELLLNATMVPEQRTAIRRLIMGERGARSGNLIKMELHITATAKAAPSEERWQVLTATPGRHTESYKAKWQADIVKGAYTKPNDDVEEEFYTEAMWNALLRAAAGWALVHGKGRGAEEDEEEGDEAPQAPGDGKKGKARKGAARGTDAEALKG